MKNLKIRESKFGQALVISTTARSGAYVLGFRVDPAEKLNLVLKEVQSLHQTYSQDPIFGVEFTIENQAPNIRDLKVARKMDDVDIVDTDEANHDALAAYYADGANKDHDKPPVLNPFLGLAVEQLNGDVTLEQLWSVL